MSAQRKLTVADILQDYSTYPDFCSGLTDVNGANSMGTRPLHLASYHGNTEAITVLIEAGAEVNIVGEMGSTPLHEAAEQGHMDAVRILLANGALVNVKDGFGHTPLETAELRGHSGVVELLSRAERS